MKKRIIYSAAIFAMLFSSCAIGHNKTNETEIIPETIDSEIAFTTSIESGSVWDTAIETVTPEEISETTSEIVPVFTGETTSEQKAPAADVSERISVTKESAPTYDDIPILTVSNIDYSSNKLEWTAIEGAQSYVFYLLNEQSGEFEEYGEVKSTSCNDKKLLPNTKYTYKVAAKFSDGLIGKMSEAVSIYTYSLYATNIQGDWVYDSEYNDDRGAKIYRRNSIDGSVEDITDYSFYSAKNICVSGEYIFFVEDFYNYSGRIIRVNMTDKSTEVLREYISDNGFGCYGIDNMAVYKNNIFFVTYGYWSETDEPKYDLYTIDFNGNDVGIGAGYQESYSPMYFLNEDDNFYIVWRDEEIVGVYADNDYILTSIYTDKCYVYDVAVKKRFTVHVPPETSDDQYNFLKYDDDFLYIEIVDQDDWNVTNLIRANEKGYEYIG